MIHVEILSPEESIFNDTAERIILPAPNGKFEVLDNHASLLSELTEGSIVLVFPSQEKKEIKIKSGFVKVEKNVVSVLVN